MDFSKYKAVGYTRYGRPSKFEITPFQHQLIIGSILGDGHISKHYRDIKTGKQINSRLTISHGIKQESYIKYKKGLFNNLMLDLIYKKSNSGFDDKSYELVLMYSKKGEIMNTYRDTWYKDKKIIPNSFIDVEAPALAIWFQDDGSRDNTTIKLATMCFTVEELEFIKDILYKKFGLVFVITKDKVLYLKTKYINNFKNLVLPYICPTMLYKFSSRIKTNLKLETPEVDNQLPTIGSVESTMEV